MIDKDDPRTEAARKALDAMHEFWKLQPMTGAVQWIEDSDGRLIVFTRGEYKDAIRRAIGEGLTPDEIFEVYEMEVEPESPSMDNGGLT